MKFRILTAFIFAFTASSLLAEVPSKQTLANMGLSSMQVVSDEEGYAVRGMAFGTLFLRTPVINITGVNPTVESLLTIGSTTFGSSTAIVTGGTGPVSRFGSIGTGQVIFDPITGRVIGFIDSGAVTITVPIVATVNGQTVVLTTKITYAGTLFGGGQ